MKALAVRQVRRQNVWGGGCGSDDETEIHWPCACFEEQTRLVYAGVENLLSVSNQAGSSAGISSRLDSQCFVICRSQPLSLAFDLVGILL
jgi:hypothetical protein